MKRNKIASRWISCLLCMAMMLSLFSCLLYTSIHETNGSAGWKNYTLSGPAAGHYVRMLGIKRGNARYGYSMYEFQVFGYQPQNPKPVTSIRLSQNTLSLLLSLIHI